MDVDDLIARGRAALDKVKPTDIPGIDVAGSPVTVRFWPLSGPEWRALTATQPAKPGSTTDQTVGYDIDAVLREYPKVYIVDGDDVVNVAKAEPKEKDSDPDHRKWYDLIELMDGPDLKTLAIALWGMHEFAAQKRAEAAGKALAGGRQKRRS